MENTESHESIMKEIESLSIQMDNARNCGNTPLYNSLVSQYNSLLDSLEQVEPECLNDSNDSPMQLSGSTIQVPIGKMAERHSGICNVLNGIVSNCKKGKYTERDKEFLVFFMTEITERLKQIDADVAYAEKQKRKSQYSRIDERL